MSPLFFLFYKLRFLVVEDKTLNITPGQYQYKSYDDSKKNHGKNRIRVYTVETTNGMVHTYSFSSEVDTMDPVSYTSHRCATSTVRLRHFQDRLGTQEYTEE